MVATRDDDCTHQIS